MTRYLNLVFVLVVLIAAATVFDMKHAAELSAEEVAALKQQIAEEREQIQLLKAEWSLLNRPDRLQGLVERYNAYLELEPLTAEQITLLENLPVKPVDLEPVKSDSPLGGYAGDVPSIQ
ncbi:hypothetical protein HPQ64_09040 [Rhizobiales bacterium]|uniref:cell division protein FtsL n=1 Tax=Hongsoonwoonella zoysiae TaxID=2821844 RepID=UPI0015600EF0|nr:hypothetical protein [Hongsoonwoonella zoysiae]NRG17833.1 hypothetical protein [Hongsoonwoonella zoysiae]